MGRDATLLAFDLGASSGRAVVGRLRAGRLLTIPDLLGAVRSLDDARDLIEQAFPPRPFEPSAPAIWESAYNQFHTYCAKAPEVFHLS
jgi:hypothetical protein